MKTAPPMTAIATAALIVSSVVLAAYLLGAFSPDGMRIDGGFVISESADELTIWCYRPHVDLSLDDFSGAVVLHNCISRPEVSGAADAERIDNTSFRFQALGGRVEATIDPPPKDAFAFAVMGDSQGHNDILRAMLSDVGGCDFALLCGDLTPSGAASEFAAFQETINASVVPVYLTAGNHDVRTDGGDEYRKRFGPAEYGFDYCGVRFAVVDSSDLNVTAEQIDWLRSEFDGADKRVMMTHAPCYDPFGDSHMLWPDSCSRLLAFIDGGEVDAVLSGHIHAFNHTNVGAVDLIISGGAGASLVEGEHHYVKVTVDELHHLEFAKSDVALEPQSTSALTVIGRGGETRNITYEVLFAMESYEGASSFENYLGNIGGLGYYTGVAVSDLVGLVGGMETDDLLRVTATDGYYQDFGYLNVYPDEAWLALQGIMLIALTMDSQPLPDWEDGPKLIMLAPDGLYDNTDCEATSYDGQGYHIYPSAGARWVKNTATIQVMPCE
ncbi:MAG: metallophosphoesterase [Methanobacteriota archaeon]|nr:MAG: metallophosphoesterase [Euryarchaeota archaeon]